MPPRRPIRMPAPETEEARFWRWTLWLLFIVTVARLVWLALDRTDLVPAEARLWVWGQAPSWSYPGAPPLTAWLVSLTSQLFGDSTPSVRIGAPILGFAASLLLYRSAALLYDLHTAFWSALVFATLPALSLASAIMSSTAPLLLFWSLALYGLLRARQSGDRRWWLLVGGALGFGLLAHYAMIYWLFCAFLYVGTVREARRQWSYLVGAAALGLAIASPSYIAAFQHGFATAQAVASADGAALWRFFLAQFLVFGPILFAALIALVALAGRTLADVRAALLVCFVLPPLALALGLSLFVHADIASAAPAYVAASILVTAWLRAEGRAILVSVSIGLHIAGAIVVGIGVRDIAELVGIDVPLAGDPLGDAAGWRRLGRAVATVRLEHPGVLLMADDRDLLDELKFYVEPHPLDAIDWNGGVGPTPGADVLLVARDIEKAPGIVAKFANPGPPRTITIFLGRAGMASKPEEQRHYAVQFLAGFKGR